MGKTLLYESTKRRSPQGEHLQVVIVLRSTYKTTHTTVGVDIPSRVEDFGTATQQ
ncbi:hypothetical protein QUB80_02445 [Chlorogloeopsis sp. ULAP01]|uniref:hypothetical protein n=1 Tax=Chlorogloeopsis sp. ULAP01 TaxID=3056483 RepID=UPI0025AA3DDA|nr:hypothetical protein [Chlorogloeopsis sp. ULAP01]MDM9379561.1 hypothetical protein [Chlorogloeopsis sp. ULAP01]